MEKQRIPLYLDCTLPDGNKHTPFNESHQFQLAESTFKVKGFEVRKDGNDIIIK
jgi:hypothetical protein